MPENILLPHGPFSPRKKLVLLALVPSAGIGCFLGGLLQGMASYFALVTLADLVSLSFSKLKPSPPVSPEQFVAYFDSRRRIRCVSLLLALGVGGIAWLFASFPFLKVFCSAYILCTWIGIVCGRFRKISRPKFFERDDRFLVLSHVGPRPGCISPEEWALNKATGFPVQGPVDF